MATSYFYISGFLIIFLVSVIIYTLSFLVTDLDNGTKNDRCQSG